MVQILYMEICLFFKAPYFVNKLFYNKLILIWMINLQENVDIVSDSYVGNYV